MMLSRSVVTAEGAACLDLRPPKRSGVEDKPAPSGRFHDGDLIVLSDGQTESPSTIKVRPVLKSPAEIAITFTPFPIFYHLLYQFYVISSSYFQNIVAVKRFCHLSLRENVTILFLNKLTSCIVIYRRCF